MAELPRRLSGGTALDPPPWAKARVGTFLIVNSGDGNGSALVPLSAASYIVGRQDGAGRIVVDHVTVSRKHAIIAHDGDRTFISDASSNGTFLNGTPIPKREFVLINDGDEIQFGDAPQTFMFSLDPGAVFPPRRSAQPHAPQDATATAPAKPLRRPASGVPAASGDPLATASPAATARLYETQEGSAEPKPKRGDFMRLCGLRLVLRGTDVVVRTVESGSAAEAHPFPFSFGDVVASVNGETLAGRPVAEIAALLERAEASESVALVVAKAGAMPKDVVLAAQPPKQPAAPARREAAADRPRSGAHGARTAEHARGGSWGGVADSAAAPGWEHPSAPEPAPGSTSAGSAGPALSRSSPSRSSLGGGAPGDLSELRPVRLRALILDALQRRAGAAEQMHDALRRMCAMRRHEWPATGEHAPIDPEGVSVAGAVRFLVEHTRSDVLAELSPALQELWLCALRVLPPADSLRYTPAKEGYLRKRGSRLGLWQRRFYTLRYCSLFYYVRESDVPPRASAPAPAPRATQVSQRARALAGDAHA